jgi:hypothetical protein
VFGVARPWWGKGAGLEDQEIPWPAEKQQGLVCSTCYSFSILWHGEAFHELGVQSADVSALLGALPQSSMSPAWITEVRRSVAVSRSPSWSHSLLPSFIF